jgi:hypothetical protein
LKVLGRKPVILQGQLGGIIETLHNIYIFAMIFIPKFLFSTVLILMCLELYVNEITNASSCCSCFDGGLSLCRGHGEGKA